VVTADIEKMYRQILIDSVDTDYQRILWRDHPNEELKTYRLTTFTYGTKPASFIATRCLFELAVQNQNMNPLASSVIKRDFYMDDLLTGADTISELSAICEDVSTILQGGGFNLRKWTSNVPLTSPKMNNNCQKNGIVNLDNDVTKTLGLLWDSKNDLLKYDAKTIDRSLIRQVIHRCNSCFRCNPKRVTQMMGDLPACRLESNRPFVISGVDYLGPIIIKESTGRGKRNVKAYVSIFVCLVTKAVHLELVGNLTTESFLGALHRLIARRGHVRHLYSDNGSNFIGAANQETKKFKSFLKSSEFQSDVINKLTERNTEFHFIPGRSPHMGGLWEINVKSVKNHIKRSIGLATPMFEEMYTLLTRIEAILNSRPLTPISNDPNDLEPLTPGHFLSPGESLTAVHEGDITEVKTNRLSRWQLVERMRQLFWRRWTREYLSRLQARSKWRNPDTTPAVGSLVLIADDELPPLRWNLARITELHLGKDGLPRVASLKTKNGATKRSVHKLCVLPLEREDVHVLTHYE
jgi:hypothetical protein